MALISCPECQKQISDSTPSCPHCGYKLVASPETPTKKGGITFGKIVLWVFLWWILMFVALYRYLEPKYGKTKAGVATAAAVLFFMAVGASGNKDRSSSGSLSLPGSSISAGEQETLKNRIRQDGTLKLLCGQQSIQSTLQFLDFSKDSEGRYWVSFTVVRPEHLGTPQNSGRRQIVYCYKGLDGLAMPVKDEPYKPSNKD